jgi:hypothetical protein
MRDGTLRSFIFFRGFFEEHLGRGLCAHAPVMHQEQLPLTTRIDELLACDQHCSCHCEEREGMMMMIDDGFFSLKFFSGPFLLVIFFLIRVVKPLRKRKVTQQQQQQTKTKLIFSSSPSE